MNKKWPSTVAAVVLLASTIAFSTAARGQANLPPGSYRDTCHSIVVHGDRLEAVCQTAAGSWQHTVLSDFQACPGGLINENGNLWCAQRGPTGSYKASCIGMTVKEGVLFARCRTKQGTYVATSIQAYCRGEVQNDDGILQCVRIPAGSYVATCNHIVVGKTTLEAFCRTASGRWRNASLEGYRACRADIRNDDGKLTCG